MSKTASGLLSAPAFNPKNRQRGLGHDLAFVQKLAAVLVMTGLLQRPE
jgi:hypothetical protein